MKKQWYIAELNRIQAQGGPQSDQEAEGEPVVEEHKYTTVEGHSIEVGQWYETRGGGKAEVIALVRRRKCPVVAVLEDLAVKTYQPSGRFGICAESGYDLMRPCDPPEEHIDYPWADFPLAQWAFTNKNGVVEFAAGAKPSYTSGAWWLYGGMLWKHPTYRRAGTDAAASLRRRPEGE